MSEHAHGCFRECAGCASVVDLLLLPQTPTPQKGPLSAPICDADATALMQAKTAMQGQTFFTVYVSTCADIHHSVLNTLLPIEDAKIHCHLVSLSLFSQGEAVQGG